MSFIQSLSDFLTHCGQVHQVTRSGAGATSVTTMNTLSCFAYFGNLDRVVEGDYQRTRPFGWSVLFPSDARTCVVVGSLVTAVLDAEDLTVLSTATVKTVNPYRHWNEGLDFIIAEVKPN